MAYRKKTLEEKQKEIEELTSKMTEQIESYFLTEDALEEHLTFMANFHNYSLRNMTLINEQFNGATAVGSFKFWQDRGVSVRKGEKGIKILVPTPVEYFKRGENWIQVKYATKQEKEQIKKGKIETQKKLFFKVGHVFEYTQTNAREKGMPVSKIFGQYHRDGIINNEKEMLAALHKIADKVGFEILTEPIEELGTAKGAAYPYGKMIALNPRNTAYENVTTLIHELAHAKIHTPDVRNTLTVAEREFQAEMVSYVVAKRYGINTEDFSLSYLANWTEQGKNLSDKEKLLQGVKETASDFITTIDEHLSKTVLNKEFEKENDLDMGHKLKITSLENAKYRDESEIAQLVFVNGITNKEYNVSIWAENIHKNKLDPYYIYQNNAQDLSTSQGESITQALDEAFYHGTLEDVVDLDKVDLNLEKSIQDYVNDETKTFSIDIPPEQVHDLHDNIVNEEIAELLLKIENNILTKDDIIDYGKLVEFDNGNRFNFDKVDGLKEKFETTLNKTVLNEDEIKYANAAFKSMNLDIDVGTFSKNEPSKNDTKSKLQAKVNDDLELPL